MISKSKALVVLNGEIPSKKLVNFLEKETNFCICADGAADVLNKYGIIPDIIIGDLDSISPQQLNFNQQTQIIRDEDQETTDGEKVLRYCLNHQIPEITLIGAFGLRLDHSLYNIGLLKKFHQQGLAITCFTDLEQLFLIDQSVTLKAEPGTRISILPVFGKASGVLLTGFEYPLRHSTLSPAEYGSISNIIKSKNARIELTSGLLLVILAHSVKLN